MALLAPKRFKQSRNLGGASAVLRVWFNRLLSGIAIGILIGAMVSAKERLSWQEHVYPLILDAMMPVVNTFDYIKDKSTAGWDGVTSYVGLHQENDQLKKELKRLGQYYLAYEQVRAENSQLKTLLNYAPELPYSYITARIVGLTAGPLSHTAMVTVGSNAGVKKGQIVINERGLLGRITDVGKNSARVLLISDSSSRIPVVTARSHERGMVAGINNSEQLQLLYLADNSAVEKGELVFSSGDGDLLPPGVVVGAVSEIHNQQVTVAPSVRFDTLEFVKIVQF